MSATTITSPPPLLADDLLDEVRRKQSLEEHGRLYAGLGLAIAWTAGIEADDAKRVTATGWNKTEPLANADFAAGLFATRGQRRNPAVVLGASGLIGVDIDGEQGRERLHDLVVLPETVVVVTGSGWHLWFRPPAPSRICKIQFAGTGVTLTRDSGYFVAPPARHPSGTTYQFLEGHEPWTTEIAVFPTEVLAQLEAEQRRDDEAARHDDEHVITEGGRHATLLRIAGAMRRAGAGQPEIEVALLTLNARRCLPPKPEHKVRDLARDVVDRYAPGERS